MGIMPDNRCLPAVSYALPLHSLTSSFTNLSQKNSTVYCSMPVPRMSPASSNPNLTEFHAFAFPPPPAKPGPVVLNRFVLYETKTRFFIVGTNAPAATRFRVLKIDRTTFQEELSITEDEAVYTKSEVDDLLEMIANGNKSTGGIRKQSTFYGIVGFVRFTEGYYITIITERSPVALIGGHYIFHINATTTFPINTSATPTSKLDKNSNEARYLQMFRMVDLSKNFYFSYSYDITRTLQWNMTRNPKMEGRNQMFVWNQYLLENGFGEQTGIENQWALPIMYGFVEQSTAALHFDDMFNRYGAPCIVLNLIKAKEKTPRESLLLSEFTQCMEYLNQFLPEDKKIWHIRWDMSRASKSRDENVISVLEILAEKAFARTGFFYSGYNHDSESGHTKNIICDSGLQNGVVRTNCIDCLDRTNAAQFIIAKCALGHQLFALGLIAEPVVPFDCDAVDMLTEMYHEHGDTIALQYGGSHLVNTMETYRKINQWTSHSRDMFESIKRFYSNSFVDAEKQDAMNLFLGNYRVRKIGPALWELPGDYHLHNITDPELKKIRKSYLQWWTPEVLQPQDELARGSFMDEHEHDQNRFQLHDAGYDSIEGPYLDEVNEEDFSANRLDQSDDHDADTDGPHADKHNSSPKKLQSEDVDEKSGIKPETLRATNRVDIIESTASGQTIQSAMSPDADKRSRIQDDSQESKGGTSVSNSNIPSPSQLDNGLDHGEPNDSRSGDELPLEGGLPDLKDRAAAPLDTHLDSSVLLMSSSSSISSMHQPYHRHQLKTSTSRSSLETFSMGGSSGRTIQPKPYFSRGEHFADDGLGGCDDEDAAGGENGSRSAVWEEYWEEYYRPKVRTSFKTLFAYEMHSTSRYIPPNKGSSEQSPFEVRQNNGVPSQAEIDSKAAAKAEKPSMLSWLGLTSSNKKNSNTNSNSKTVTSGYADGSKTMPLSTGRKKGLLSNLDDDLTFQEKSSNGYGKKDEHSRGSYSPNSVFPAGSGSEIDEKAVLRAQEQQTGRETKVRLPAHVPRSKKEEWELTKNVWSNLPSYAIHDPNFVSSTTAVEPDGKDAEALDHQKTANGSETMKDGSSSVVAPHQESGGGGHNNNNNQSSTNKNRTHLEESVRRSLNPKVTFHESEEYERYTRQFKSIKFDSVPTKGAASYGVNMYPASRDELSVDTGTVTPTPPSGSVPLGNTHQQQSRGSSTSTADSSSSTVRPSLIENQQIQDGSSTSTTTIGTAYLNEDEYCYPAPRYGENVTGQKPTRVQISTSSSGNTNSMVNGYAISGASTLSSLSPEAVPPLSPMSGATTAGRQQSYQTEWNDTFRSESEDNVTVPDDYLPEPPILAPMQTIIKPPSDSEMVLYNAHVELPKRTLYTVGQTSLDPYWGASSGTKARFEAYKMWIHKGRYGNMTMPTTAADPGNAGSHSGATNAGSSGAGAGAVNGSSAGHGAGNTGTKGSKAAEGVVFSNGTGSHLHRPLRRGSSAIYPTIDEKVDIAPPPTIITSGKDALQQQQQKEAQSKDRKRLSGFGFLQ
ncbi:phosphatidylinositol-3,5-bisphosphate 5-phosphatase [Modicella reniformis]|uniref:Phosphatidylinositol-3,5-bisphosphate 5-phosphatase n=1 Tax=Modicella reniformis TaxID=1440133 RepID=A0A9P6IM62_9FUNG|nr:phosphatidylinositol-3,5-bisphosphate 5-phosphatase [Modicella reniformis]